MEINIGPGLVVAEAPLARIAKAAAARALDRVHGMSAAEALAVLTRQGAGTCEPVARVVQGAVSAAAHRFGSPAGDWVLHGGEIGDGEPVVRVRRKAHGLATWITTETTRIRVELRLVRCPGTLPG